jgi:spore coat protein U-like protein
MRIARALHEFAPAFGAVALLAAFASDPAHAATATASFTITATVQATCLISATSMAFGTYTGALAETTSTISITCTNTTPYNVGLSVGLGAGATVAARKMTSGANLLTYALYRDAARTQIWGTTVSTDTRAGTGNGVLQPLTVYGRLYAGQFVTPGAYSDTIIATVTY